MKFETDDIGCTILQMRMQKRKRRDVVQKATPRSNPDGIVLAIYIILLAPSGALIAIPTY